MGIVLLCKLVAKRSELTISFEMMRHKNYILSTNQLKKNDQVKTVSWRRL